ncbi:MAG: D-glycerate dehydrogenase [Thermoleophilia bacterium]|nr:D-glycerate dehydrogenase [Thermoleophilia bacterium]
MANEVYVTRRVPDRVREELESSFLLRYHDSEQPPSRSELLERVVGVDGIVSMLTDRVDDELLDAAGPSLRVVANYAVGYDNVDVEACARRGIVVANTPDVLTRATAELTIALVLALLRRVAEGDRFLRRREPWIWAPTFMLGSGLEAKLLGLVGLGRIGLEVARLSSALGMRVAYATRSPRLDVPYEALSLPDLLARADVVSIHTPLTPETHHLIGARELALMRPTAVLVNTARGPVVDEEALAEALAAGTIAGAALDVFEREPAVCERLLGLENVVLCPHLGSATLETREAMGMLCVSALRSVLLEGREPANAVSPRRPIE